MKERKSKAFPFGPINKEVNETGHLLDKVCGSFATRQHEQIFPPGDNFLIHSLDLGMDCLFPLNITPLQTVGHDGLAKITEPRIIALASKDILLWGHGNTIWMEPLMAFITETTSTVVVVD